MNENLNWLETKIEAIAFQYKNDPDMLYIIKSGFPRKYLIIYEDAFGIHPNKEDQLYYTKEEIKKVFNIDIKF